MLGATIGNYRVTSRLGEGGMGVVYLAEHPALGRKAAVKVLHPDMAKDPTVVSRFFNEARATTAIKHPNIVQALDFGSLPDGSSYIVMEYLEGESLGARLKRLGKLSVAEAVEIASQTASALAAAHDKEIVHRDLKPDNIFLVPDSRATAAQAEMVKVLDFGIAKLAGPLKESTPHQTRTGSLIGTPLYMSPEQALGNREVDGRSDIYALGVILYEMLTGAPPFSSDGFGALINMHINDAPPSLLAKNPIVPKPIADAVMKALAKDPRQRFAGMREFREALGGIPSSAISGVRSVPTAVADTQPVPAVEAPGPSVTGPTVPEMPSPARQGRGPRLPLVVLGLGTVAIAVVVMVQTARKPDLPQPPSVHAAVPRFPAAVPATPAPTPATTTEPAPTPIQPPPVAASPTPKPPPSHTRKPPKPTATPHPGLGDFKTER